MEQFREGRKPVNKMKPYIFIIGIVTLTCLGCTTREEREIKALMTAVFQKELGAGRKVILFEDAETNWEVPWLDSCSAEGILSLESDFHHKVSTKDIFTLEDVEKICREGREPYRFRKEMFPEGIHVSPDRSRYDSIVEAFYKHLGEPEIVELDMELRKYMKYKAISKPVFLQGYRYAFLYISREGPHFSVYKKDDGDWTHYFTITLMLV